MLMGRYLEGNVHNSIIRHIKPFQIWDSSKYEGRQMSEMKTREVEIAKIMSNFLHSSQTEIFLADDINIVS